MNKPKIHVDIDGELKKKLKVIAAQKGKKIKEIITIIVEEFVKKNKA